MQIYLKWANMTQNKPTEYIGNYKKIKDDSYTDPFAENRLIGIKLNKKYYFTTLDSKDIYTDEAYIKL